MEALRFVIDPELGYNIVDLPSWSTTAASSNLVMTTTTRGCPTIT
ncbi:metal-sulfur cluster biosynthetic enzyme [Mesorhizobium shonense]|uniref:Metal-sulfur cluster biosynthetic enzyme n=1 Tax=Mesorhizobium shonense TaxID=1209948 RepID=A0ABV2I2A8_9HYPH